MKRQTILIILFIMMSSDYVRGQMMFGADNLLRTTYLPSAAGYENQVYGTWLEYNSYLGLLRTGNSVIGLNWRLPIDKMTLFQKETEIGIGPLFQYRETEFWNETYFKFPIASRVKIADRWWTSVGFSPTIKLYSEPRELTREQYDDPTFLPTRARQVVSLTDISWSLDYGETFYFDIGCQNVINKAFTGTSGPKVDETRVWTMNTAYKIGKKQNPTKVRVGMLFELSGLEAKQKIMWLARPNVQLLFLDESFWLKYTLIKNNSLEPLEFAHRFLVGGFSKTVNLNFAYTVGNSQLYKNSQGNFELFIIWTFDKNNERAFSSKKDKKKALDCPGTKKKFKKR